MLGECRGKFKVNAEKMLLCLVCLGKSRQID